MFLKKNTIKKNTVEIFGFLSEPNSPLQSLAPQLRLKVLFVLLTTESTLSMVEEVILPQICALKKLKWIKIFVFLK